MAKSGTGPSDSDAPMCNDTNVSSGSSIADDTGYHSDARGYKLLKERFQRQKNYMHKLRATVDTIESSEDFWALTSEDKKYEQRLKEKDAAYTPSHALWKTEGVTTRQPILRSSKPKASIYEIDLVAKGFDCGTILVINPSLQQLCELGGRLESEIQGFDLDPKFIMKHLSTSEEQMYPQGPRFMCNMNGWAVEAKLGSLEILIEKPKGPSTSVLAEALIRVSCYHVKDSLFLLLVRVPSMPLKERPEEKAAAIPVSGWDAYNNNPSRLQELPVLLSRCIGDLFYTEWDCRRICDLWNTTPRMYDNDKIDEIRACAFLWVSALQGFGRKIKRLAEDIRALDYEVIKLKSNEALDHIKKRRGEVSELRQDLAHFRDAVRKNGLVECYQIIHDEALHRDIRRDPEDRPKLDKTVRQNAGSSFDEEYDWIDGRAKDLILPLNQNLQVIMTTMSVEQTKMALDDAAVSKKNNERSMIFAGLAALYLPLNLATSLFGMNIRGIDASNPLGLWAFIIVALILTTLSVLSLWLFYRREIWLPPLKILFLGGGGAEKSDGGAEKARAQRIGRRWEKQGRPGGDYSQV